MNKSFAKLLNLRYLVAMVLTFTLMQFFIIKEVNAFDQFITTSEPEKKVFDLYKKKIKNLTLGMDYKDVVDTLKNQGFVLEAKKKKSFFKTDIGKQFHNKFPNETLKFFLIQQAKKVNSNNLEETIRVGFSHPIPGKEQQLTAVYYETDFGKDVSIEAMVNKIKSKYGQNGKISRYKNRIEISYDYVFKNKGYNVWLVEYYKNNEKGIAIKINDKLSIYMVDTNIFWDRVAELKAIIKKDDDKKEKERKKDYRVNDF